VKVLLCIATFRRPAGLARLLEGVRDLAVAPGTALSVLVVDNDPAATALDLCARLAEGFPMPLHYAHEPRPGISHARNRAVEEARARGADWIAFLDDDEVPTPGWLMELVRVQDRYDADVVCGPVLARFEEPAPDWVVRGRFFDRAQLATGSAVPYAHTGNVLIRAALFQDPACRFDERLALTGGEDTLFFLQLAAAGRRLVWADDAVVHEWLPAARVRARWLLRRSFRKGTAWSYCERRVRPGGRVRLVRLAKGLGRIVRGSLRLPVALVRGRSGVVATLQDVAVGAGNLAGMVGFVHREYGEAQDR
jgi:succinoglycan biosynthesis protein ExoM